MPRRASWPVGELADDLVRQISAFEQAEQVALLKMGIARQGEQNFLRGLFEEALNLGALLETLARGEVRHFGAILEGSGARAQGRVRVGRPAAPVARALICMRGRGQGRDGGRPHRWLGQAIKAQPCVGAFASKRGGTRGKGGDWLAQ